MSHTTSLRELIERWRKESDDFERDGDEGSAASYYNCADELEGVIAALGEGQEVAPVAWEYRERGSDAPWVRGEGSINAQYNAEYWEVRRLYDHPPVSTAHTSGARELTDAQCDAIYSALDGWARDVDSYDFGLPMHAGGGTVTARDVIRAAMRQEGGTP